MTIATNNRARAREARRFNMMVDIMAAKYIPSFSRSIVKAFNKSASFFSKNKTLPGSEIMDKHQKDLNRILKKAYKSAAYLSGDRQLLFFKPFIEMSSKNYKPVIITKGTQENIDTTFEVAARLWIDEEGLLKSVLISETTMKDIARIIGSLQSEGAGVSEIAREIRKAAPTLARFRAVAIARTEVHNAASFGSLEATASVDSELQLGLKKVWNTVEDERTRSSHAAIDGDKVGMKEGFVVNGEVLQRPGDPNGSASNVVNCRCVLTYRQK